jgi:hypothetical protein
VYTKTPELGSGHSEVEPARPQARNQIDLNKVYINSYSIKKDVPVINL